MTNTQRNGRCVPNTNRARCQGITLNNKPCTRSIDKGNKYCWQHRFSRKNGPWYLQPTWQFIISVLLTLGVFVYQDRTNATKTDLEKLPQQLEAYNKIGLLKPRYKIEQSSRLERSHLFHNQSDGLWKIHINPGETAQLLGPYVPFSIKKELEGLSISLIMLDWDGKVIAEIRNNKWTRNPPLSLKYNYDDSAFEIIDQTRVPILQIEYVDQETIRFGGVFRSGKIPISEEFPDFPCDLENGKGIVILGQNQSLIIGKGWMDGPAYPDSSQLNEIRTNARKMILPWFDYSDPEKLGVRLQNHDVEPIGVTIEDKRLYETKTNRELKAIVAEFNRSLVVFIQTFDQAIHSELNKLSEEREPSIHEKSARHADVFEKFTTLFKLKFQRKALVLQAVLLDRLPSEPKDLQTYDYEHPVNIWSLRNIVADLDRLSGKLNSVD